MNQDGKDNQTGSFSQLTPGQKIGHFKVLNQIGAGGMGTVFLAQDLELDRKVALKCLSLELSADEQFQARFKREAKILANLNHPNVVGIYEVFQAEGRWFIAMEYVEGKPLNELKNRSLEDNLQAAIDLARGLKTAHDAGIVHRDVKPANILVSHDGHVKILDFGLAKRDNDQDLTNLGTTAGTFAYMSPEQVRGMPIDKRSDLFSFGVVLYEMVVGRHPFRGEYAAEVTYKIVAEPPSALESGKYDVPQELLRIMVRCLEKDPIDRYQDASQLVDDLTHFQRVLKGGGQYSTDQLTPKPKSSVLVSPAETDLSRIPDKPPTPSKSLLTGGFIAAIAGVLLLIFWTPLQMKRSTAITFSPIDAEKRAVEILHQEGDALFGFDIYTFGGINDTVRKVQKCLGAEKTDFQSLEKWAPSSWYNTLAISADGQERYSIRTALDGRILSYHHFLRPDIKPDTASIDSIRTIAQFYAEKTLGLQLSRIREIAPAQSVTAGQVVTDLQWICPDTLAGNSVGELRASFLGSHLTNIGSSVTFPEILKRTIKDYWDYGSAAAFILWILGAVVLCIYVTRSGMWHFPSMKAFLLTSIPLALIGIFIAKFSYIVQLEIMGQSTAVFAIGFIFVIGAMIAIFYLTFAAVFGILGKIRPTILAGLALAPKGQIKKEAFAGSLAVGMTAGAIVYIVQSLYKHVVLLFYGGSPTGLAFAPTVSPRWVEVSDFFADVFVNIVMVGLALSFAVVLGRQQRLRNSGWLLIALVWTIIKGSFLTSDGMTNWLALSGLLLIAAILWVSVKYGIIAGILGMSAHEIIESGISFAHYGTPYYKNLGYFWIMFWFIIAAISIYYVIRKMTAEKPALSS